MENNKKHNNSLKVLQFPKDNSPELLKDFCEHFEKGEFKGICLIGLNSDHFDVRVSNWGLDNLSHLILILERTKLNLLNNIFVSASPEDDNFDNVG